MHEGLGERLGRAWARVWARVWAKPPRRKDARYFFVFLRNWSRATTFSAGAALSGLDRFVARERVWEALESSGLALKTEPHVSRVPRSQRGGEICEPPVGEQWFVKMESLAAPGAS